MNRQRVIEGLRVTGLLLAVAAIGLLATGCSNSNTSSTAASKVKIRVWRVGQSEDVLKTQISSFVKRNPSVEVTYKQRKLPTYELDALKSLAARTGPDIWSLPNDWLGDHENRITPLPDNFFYERDSKGNVSSTGKSPLDSIKELYPDGIATAITSTDGKSVLGLPTNVDTLRLYVNLSLFDTAFNEYKAGQGKGATSQELNPVKQLLSKPPVTWLDLADQTKYITKKTGTTIDRGTIALGTADNIPYSNDIVQLLMMQNGADIVSSDHTRALFHIPKQTASGITVRPGEIALDFYTSFADPTRETYTWNASMPQAVDAFAQGKVAMIIGYSDLSTLLKTKYPKFRFDMAAMPQLSATDPAINLISFSTEAVTKTADNSAAAFAFLRTYTNNATADNIARQGNYSSPFLATLKKKTSDIYYKQVLTGKTVFKRFRSEFDDSFRQMIINVNQNGVPADQALDSNAQTINELLGREEIP